MQIIFFTIALKMLWDMVQYSCFIVKKLSSILDSDGSYF